REAAPSSSAASCSPGMKRTLGFFSPRARSRNSASRRRRSRGSSVVWVRSPVKTTKSGCVSRALTAAIAFGRVPAASGLTAGPWNPQWVSESWMKKILGGLLLAFAFALPQANAGLVPTERERVKALIERPEVAQQMEKMGIPAKEALARVDAMTDEEVRSLAGRLDALPAGGQISSQTLLLICLIIILLLLI